jgi:hypothetical protein
LIPVKIPVLSEKEIKVRYLHSEIDTLERTEIIRQLRAGKFDVLVGINLLREGIDIPEVNLKSTLHKEVQRLVSNWFGATGTFIEMTLKCPLGQLTKEQIDKGRLVLDDCKLRILASKDSAITEYDRLTSQFYSLIPHVLPSRIQADVLRLNTIDKIMEKHDILDTFLDAKNVQSVLGKETHVDEKYKQLKADISYVEYGTELWKWIDSMVHRTRAHNHGYFGKIVVHNIFCLARHNEDKYFCARADEIAKVRTQKIQTWPEILVGVGDRRTDIDKERSQLYNQANVLPLWHGTRNENMVGILCKGLIKKPAGVIYTGSMFGEAAAYFAASSTKSCGYTSCQGAVWSGGREKRGFLFLGDVCLGNPKIANRSYYYTDRNILPHHSVWAKAGGGVINDEIMVYQSSGIGQQHNLRYIVEIETQVR